VTRTSLLCWLEQGMLATTPLKYTTDCPGNAFIWRELGAATFKIVAAFLPDPGWEAVGHAERWRRWPIGAVAGLDVMCVFSMVAKLTVSVSTKLALLS
jgi:hypothetical protein